MLVHFKVYEEGGVCVTILANILITGKNNKQYIVLKDEKGIVHEDVPLTDIVGLFHGFIDVPKI